jgi:hypothetical protein
MADDLPLKRIYPKPDPSISVSLHEMGPLYLEDVEAIHEILGDVAQEDPLNETELAIYRAKQERHALVQEFAERLDGGTSEAYSVATIDPPVLQPVMKMESDEFEIPSLTQLRKMPYDKLPQFRINIWRPRIWIYGGGGHFYISLDDASDPEARAAFDQIVRIVERRKLKWSALINLPVKWIMALSLVLTLFLTPLLFVTSWVSFAAAVFALNAMFPILLVAEVFHWSKRRPAVVTIYRRDSPDFWQRNRDALVTGTVIAFLTATATATAIVTLLVT